MVGMEWGVLGDGWRRSEADGMGFVSTVIIPQQSKGNNIKLKKQINVRVNLAFSCMELFTIAYILIKLYKQQL